MSAAGSLSPDPPARAALIEAIDALLPRRLHSDGEETTASAFTRPLVAANCADAVLALFGVPVDVPTSTITRALARSAAIEATEPRYFATSSPQANDAHNSLLRRLRAVGSPVPGDPKA